MWVSPRVALNEIGLEKLVKLTLEADQQELIGTGDAGETFFVTPFVFGTAPTIRVDGTIPSSGVTIAVSPDPAMHERWTVTFATAPAAGVKITASSTDGVNADVLDHAFQRAQDLVRGPVDAANYDVPTDDANPASVPAILKTWTGALAWYFLASDPRRPGLLEAYPELLRRYDDVFGGVDSDLKRVAKGTFSLRGVLGYRTVTATPGAQQVGWVSNPKVYVSGGVF